MMKTQSDLFKTNKCKEQVSKYGVYYLNIKKRDGYTSSFRLYIQKEISSEYCPLQKTTGEMYSLVDYEHKIISWPSKEHEYDYNILLPYNTMLRVIKEKAFRDIFSKIIDDKLNKNKDKTLSEIIHHHCDFFQDYGYVIKDFLGMKITFEDIEEMLNVEFREQALKKFGYEKYIIVGIKQGKILEVITDKEMFIGKDSIFYFRGDTTYTFHGLKNFLYYNDEECIIVMHNGIHFLKVKDSSNDKIYFLKIPPGIRDIQEAKAWTFGLSKLQYDPVMET